MRWKVEAKYLKLKMCVCDFHLFPEIFFPVHSKPTADFIYSNLEYHWLSLYRKYSTLNLVYVRCAWQTCRKHYLSAAGLNEHKHWRENICFAVLCPVWRSDARNASVQLRRGRWQRSEGKWTNSRNKSCYSLNIRLQHCCRVWRMAAAPPRLLRVGSAGWSAGRGRRLGCGVCWAARWGSAPGPGRSRRGGTFRTSSGTHAAAQVHYHVINILKLHWKKSFSKWRKLTIYRLIVGI